MTGIQVRTISKSFICILVDNGSEVFLIAIGVPFGFLAFVSRAMIAVLNVLLRLEFEGFNFLLIAGNIADLHYDGITASSMSIFSPKREGALSKFSIMILVYFYFPDSSFLCC